MLENPWLCSDNGVRCGGETGTTESGSGVLAGGHKGVDILEIDAKSTEGAINKQLGVPMSRPDIKIPPPPSTIPIKRAESW